MFMKSKGKTAQCFSAIHIPDYFAWIEYESRQEEMNPGVTFNPPLFNEEVGSENGLKKANLFLVGR